MDFGLHLAQMAAVLLVAAAPLPLGLALLLLYRDEFGPPLGLARQFQLLGLSWCTIQMALGTLLGAISLLRPAAILGAETFLLVLGSVIFLRVRPRISRAQHKSLPRLGEPLRRAELVMLALGGSLGLALLWRILAWPAWEYDTLAYHLPSIAHWYREGGFAMLDPLHQVSRFPFGWELLSAMLSFPLGEDFAVELPNLLAWGLLGLGVHVLARRIGAPRPWAMAAALCLLGAPAIVDGVDSMKVDVAMAAFFLAALELGLRALERQHVPSLAALLACLGMMAGIKLSGPTYAGLLLMILVPLAIWRRRAFGRSGHALPWLLGGVILALACAAFWYGRNWIQTGSPLAFIEVKLGSWTLLKGHLTSEYLRATSFLRVFRPNELEDYRVVGRQLFLRWGPAVLLGAALGAATLPRLWAKTRAERRPQAVALIALGLGCLLFYIITPGSGSIALEEPRRITGWVAGAFRFAFPFAGLVAVLAARGLAVLPARAVLAPGLVVLSIAWGAWREPGSELAGGWGATVAISIALVIVATTMMLVRRGLTRGGIRAGLALLLLAPLVTAPLRELRDSRRAASYGPPYEFLETTLRPGDTVAYLQTRHPHSLQGRWFARRLLAAEPGAKSFDQYLAFLQRNGVDVIVVGQAHKQVMDDMKRSPIRRWLKNRRTASRFELIHGKSLSEESLVYRFHPGPARGFRDGSR